MNSSFHNISDEVIKVLEELGFTKYEKRVLLGLYVNGESSAEELASAINVPYARVYDIIQSLERKSLVEIIPGRPRKYIAKEPQQAFQEYLSRLEERLREELEKQKELVTKLIPSLESLYQETHAKIEPNDLLENYNSLAEMERVTLNLIKQARKEIIIFTKVFSWYDLIKEELIRALQRGVTVKVLLGSYKETKATIMELRSQGALIREMELPFYMARGTMIDNEKVVFVIWADEEKGRRRIYRPQYSQNPGVILLIRNNFEYLWRKEEFKEAK